MAQANQGSQMTGTAPETLDDCMAQLDQARRELDATQDKYLRAAAQAENTRKWAERDAQARATQSKRDLLRQLLEVMDNLERALAQPADAAALQEGVQLTLRQLEQVLARAGVQRIAVEPGQPFDPLYHEAVEVRHDGVPQDTVTEVVHPGYRHDGFVIRPAQVVVTRPDS